MYFIVPIQYTYTLGLKYRYFEVMTKKYYVTLNNLFITLFFP